MNNIFESHAHYTDSSFDCDRDTLLEELPKKGIKYVMLASAAMEDTILNSELSQKYDYIYAAAGIHPESVDSTPVDFPDFLRNIIGSNPKIKAVGEIGLDYHYDGFDRDKQIALFTRQLELARELDMPVIVHSRDAVEDTLRILREYKPRGVVHCFSGSAETAREVLALGMYIGFTGVITFKNAKKALSALEAVPMDRLLIETDCPYMAPEPFRGKRCDSSMLVQIAEKAAGIKNVTPQEIADASCQNAMRLFGIGQQ